MFGHDTLNFANINNLLMAENKTFNAATPLPADYIWDESDKVYVIKAKNATYHAGYLDGVKVTGWMGNSTMTTEQKINSTKSVLPIGSYYVLSDAELPTAPPDKDCPSENREDGATAWECGDCLSGFTEDATGVCIADVDTSTDETDGATKGGTNWLLYGGIGIAAIAGYFALK